MTSYGPLAAARRILAPKLPRATSLSRLRSLEAERLSNMLLGLPGVVGGLAHDASPLSTPPTMKEESPQLPGPMLGQGAAPPLSRPTSRLSQSLSQPMMRHSDQPPVGGLVQELGGRLLYSPAPPPTTPVPESQSMMGETLWAAGVVRQLPASGSARRTLQLGDGQQHLLAITPTHGEEILIPVDYHQASKEADEKRQRNAGASARFRQRKKEREKEQQQVLQKLETQNHELEKKVEDLERRNQDLEAERDFLQDERNRLRDIVSRTPGISEWADRGPPSPTPPASYGDPSMLERLAKRRRTDSEPGLGTLSYRPTSSLLPPLAGGPPPAYAVPQSPHLAAASPKTARLPPIRFNHPYPTSETSPPLQPGPPPPPAPPQIGQPSTYSSFTKTPYEWATSPRGPPEGGPRPAQTASQVTYAKSSWACIRT
ncbi:hypothetical protein QBC47DRAFT_302550 [Echria macrotheca]|uniref:BZIP domain-containing protein n=1 Tax=Echria macrotheca TaxID=438768 RepID=A0AAJ0B9G4_9PEZI|nr:hypothetical protein QBC47DRAFT_302550 [Echria macrotheca]